MTKQPVSGAARGVVRHDPIERKQRRPVKAVSQDNRVHNRSLVLRSLYHDGPMSRSDLARASGLTRPTVSALIADLLQEGLVTEVGVRSEQRMGKPAMLVRLKGDALNVVALDLSEPDRITGAVLDLHGEVTARSELPLGDAVGAAAYTLVEDVVRLLRNQAQRPILGIGVGAPGLIDDEGTVRVGSHLQWTDLPLAGRLAAQFGVPVFVGNDLNMAALGVLHFRDVNASDLLVISVENAIGMGIVINGSLVEGESFAAGEVGHLTVDDRGDTCLCGRRGCLEVYVAAAHAVAGDDAVPADERVAKLTDAGRALGVMVAPITMALNLSTVVILGRPNLVTSEFIDALTATIQARTLPVINASVTVIPMTSDDLVVLGATSRVLSRELGVL